MRQAINALVDERLTPRLWLRARGVNSFPATPQFGRKGLLISASSVLLTMSCFYRAIWTASEGAALCRGSPSMFNAPFAGRLVATFGEVAFCVQVGTYVANTSRRLGVRGRVWSQLKSIVFAPVLLAEFLSWCGVVSGNARFFCLEYFTWCVIACCWAWDSAECLHKSQRWGDLLCHTFLLLLALGAHACMHACIPHTVSHCTTLRFMARRDMCATAYSHTHTYLKQTGLLIFNLLFEIPHFWSNFQRVATGEVDTTVAAVGSTTMWACRKPEGGKRAGFSVGGAGAGIFLCGLLCCCRRRFAFVSSDAGIATCVRVRTFTCC